MAKKDGMVIVTFTKATGGYMVGVQAGFSKALADRFVKNKHATYSDPDIKAAAIEAARDPEPRDTIEIPNNWEEDPPTGLHHLTRFQLAKRIDPDMKPVGEETQGDAAKRTIKAELARRIANVDPLGR